MSSNAGAVQGQGLEVTDEDVKGPVTPEVTDPKAEKQTDPKSQSTPDKPSTEAPEQTKESGPGPWDAKLQELGLTDPRFSEFLRSEVQPYVTQLEQGGGNDLFGGDQEQAQVAHELLSAFQADPERAYQELGELLGLTDPGMEDGMEDEEFGMEGDPELDDEPGTSADPRLDYVDQIMQREKEAAEDAEYDAFVSQMFERLPGFDDQLFTELVVSNGGNLDAALNKYMRYHKPAAAAEEAAPVAEGGTPPPVAPKYDNVGDAISGWMDENKASGGKPF